MLLFALYALTNLKYVEMITLFILERCLMIMHLHIIHKNAYLSVNHGSVVNSGTLVMDFVGLDQVMETEQRLQWVMYLELAIAFSVI